MARWHNEYVDNCAHFCTASVVDWRPLLVGDAPAVLYEEWEVSRDLLGVKMLAYVIMPDHFHIILWANNGEKITKFLLRTLSISARRISCGGLWKERPRVFAMRSLPVVKARLDYLHRNPLRKHLVENPEDWTHSSYSQLVLGRSGSGFMCDGWEMIY